MLPAMKPNILHANFSLLVSVTGLALFSSISAVANWPAWRGPSGQGDVTSKACQVMQAHVDGCPQCATRCHSLRSILSACNATPVPVLSPELKLAVREQMRRSLSRQTGA